MNRRHPITSPASTVHPLLEINPGETQRSLYDRIKGRLLLIEQDIRHWEAIRSRTQSRALNEIERRERFGENELKHTIVLLHDVERKIGEIENLGKGGWKLNFGAFRSRVGGKPLVGDQEKIDLLRGLDNVTDKFIQLAERIEFVFWRNHVGRQVTADSPFEAKLENLRTQVEAAQNNVRDLIAQFGRAAYEGSIESATETTARQLAIEHQNSQTRLDQIDRMERELARSGYARLVEARIPARLRESRAAERNLSDRIEQVYVLELGLDPRARLSTPHYLSGPAAQVIETLALESTLQTRVGASQGFHH
jgi:hypothetical protein